MIPEDINILTNNAVTLVRVKNENKLKIKMENLLDNQFDKLKGCLISLFDQ